MLSSYIIGVVASADPGGLNRLTLEALLTGVASSDFKRAASMMRRAKAAVLSPLVQRSLVRKIERES